MASLQIRYPPYRPLAPNPSSRNFTTRFKCFKPLEASPNSDLPLDGEDNPDMSDPVKLAFSRAEAYRQQKLQAQGEKLEANLSGKGGKSSVVDNPFSGTDHSISLYSAISSNCSSGLTGNTFWIVQIGVLKHGAEPNPFTMSTNFFLKFANVLLSHRNLMHVKYWHETVRNQIKTIKLVKHFTKHHVCDKWAMFEIKKKYPSSLWQMAKRKRY